MAPTSKRGVGRVGELCIKGGGVKPVSRKKMRQQERAAKKQRKALYHSRQSQVLADQEVASPKAAESSVTKGSSSSQPSKRQGVNAVASKNKVQSSRASEQEKQEISRLEKLLKIDKKKKSLPNSFRQDGLDCILTYTDLLPPIQHHNTPVFHN